MKLGNEGRKNISGYVLIIIVISLVMPFLANMNPSAHADSYNSITPDGDLGDWAADERMGTDATKVFYLTWDDANLYIGWDGTDWSTDGNLFVYLNTSSGGSYSSIDWDGIHSLPFDADYALAVDDSVYYDLREFSGGSWNVIRDNNNFGSPAPHIGWSGNPVTEIAINRTVVDLDSGLDIMIFAQWEEAVNVWASFPVGNPARGAGSEVFTHYYHIPSITEGISPDTIEIKEKTGGVEPREDALNLAIVWHQHQPYYKNVLTGKYEMPWVRVHGSQEYLDSPKILMEHPGVKVTFNIVPSLMEQIEDYANNDILDRNTLWLLKGIGNLTELEKHEMQFEFFWVPSWQYNLPNEASRYYHYLHNKTMHNLTPETIMDDTLLPDNELFDLMVLYHLFQISPWYAEGRYDIDERDDTIMVLYDKFGGFTQTDLDYILAKQTSMLDELLGVYAEARDAGQAEIITSPYSHPIMPLLMMPGWSNEQGRYIYKEAWYQDTVSHMGMAKDIYNEHFGEDPVGLWPSEQSVSEDVIEPIADTGIKWMISDEMVLEKSGFEISDNNILCKPYIVENNGKEIKIIFRDRVISDRIAWQYGKMDASAAVDDFLDYVKGVRDSLTDPGSSLLTVALDGENWMFMSFEERDNGRTFMDELYGRLENTDWIRTVGVWDHIQNHPPNPATDTIDVLARDCPNGAGSWIDGTMSTWSGEEEESLAWERLIAARELVVTRERDNPSDPALPAAWKSIFAAEGSDWFWWYGLDQDSGYDELWDELFKVHLMNVYTSLGEEFPPYLKNLWLPPEIPSVRASDVIDPGIDGFSIPGEWEGSYRFSDRDDEAVDAPWDIREMNVGYSSRNLFVRIDLSEDDLKYMWKNEDADISLYVGAPNARDMNIFSTNYITKYGKAPLNYPAKLRIKLLPGEVLSNGRAKFAVYEADGKENWVYKLDLTGDTVALNDAIEWAVPFKTLGLSAGDEFRLRVVTANASSKTEHDIAPKLPMSIRIPRDISPEVVLLSIPDTLGDETGDGDYSYPLASDFAPHKGLWDIVSTEISATEYDLIFRLEFAEMTNVWHMRQGFCHEIIQIYIDQDRISGSGNLEMLPGANAEVTPDFAWEVAVSATGDAIFVQKETGEKLSAGCEASGNEETKKIEIIASKSLVGSDVADYGYVIVVGSQDGFGTGKFRDVDDEPGVWTLGGGAAPNAADGKDYDPGIIDAVLSEEDESKQSTIISSYSVPEKKYARIPGIEIPEMEQQIFGVKTKGQTASGAIIGWQTTKPGTSMVEFGTSATLGTATNEDKGTNTSHTVILSGLAANTTYHYKVASRDGADGDLYYSDIFTFNTTASMDTNPPMIILPGADMLNETAAEIHWLTDELATGLVEIGESENELASGGSSDGFRKSHSVTVTRLVPGAKYYYLIRVEDSSGNQNSTPIRSFLAATNDDDGSGSWPGDEGTFTEKSVDGLTLKYGTYHAQTFDDLNTDDLLSVTGRIGNASVDVLVLEKNEFLKYENALETNDYYKFYSDPSRFAVLGNIAFSFKIPLDGSYSVVFDYTAAPLGGGMPVPGVNATVSYQITVERGSELQGLNGENVSWGAYPQKIHQRSFTLAENSYGYVELPDCKKGVRVHVELTVASGKVDVLLFDDSNFQNYKFEKSPDVIEYTFLEAASRLNVGQVSYILIIPRDGSYFLVVENTPDPPGGANAGDTVDMEFLVALDSSGPPLPDNIDALSEETSVEIPPESDGTNIFLYVLVISGITIGILVIFIMQVSKKIRDEQNRLEKKKNRRNGGGD